MVAYIPGSLDPVFLLRIIEGPLELLEDSRKRRPGPGLSNMGMMGTSVSFYPKNPDRLFARKSNTMDAVEVVNKYIFTGSSKKERESALLHLIQDDPALREKLEKERNLNREVLMDYIKAYNFRKLHKVK